MQVRKSRWRAHEGEERAAGRENWSVSESRTFKIGKLARPHQMVVSMRRGQEDDARGRRPHARGTPRARGGHVPMFVSDRGVRTHPVLGSCRWIFLARWYEVVCLLSAAPCSHGESVTLLLTAQICAAGSVGGLAWCAPEHN